LVPELDGSAPSRSLDQRSELLDDTRCVVRMDRLEATRPDELLGRPSRDRLTRRCRVLDGRVRSDDESGVRGLLDEDPVPFASVFGAGLFDEVGNAVRQHGVLVGATGFLQVVTDPAEMASLATSSLPLPVKRTNGSSGWSARTVVRNSIPFRPGMS
jgi:hypothetical protein